MNNITEFMNNITEFNKGSIYYQGLKNTINTINNSKEILNRINTNNYFYFNVYTLNASSNFQLFEITAENYLASNKKNKYTKNEILHIISNN